MDFTIREIKKIIDMLDNSQLVELEITQGEKSIRLSKYNNKENLTTSVIENRTITNPIVQNIPINVNDVNEKKDTVIDGYIIKSPIVGVFYRSASPESAPFVNVGDKVEVGQTLCIVEAMKVMNHVHSDKAGIIQQILVEDADSIEYDQTLFVIK
jgi:acetyl-CoA carboxylase biotin carboxyl carrier protein